QVLRRLTAVRDWSGGTRIGESLAQFNREWSHLVDRRTIVIVLSDGWDTGEPELLAGELLRIKRRAGRVIWLNPLLGNPSYEPLTRGMAAGLPLVDDFGAAHHLASLRGPAAHLPLESLAEIRRPLHSTTAALREFCNRLQKAAGSFTRFPRPSAWRLACNHFKVLARGDRRLGSGAKDRDTGHPAARGHRPRSTAGPGSLPPPPSLQFPYPPS